MPTIAQFEMTKPKLWEEFEDIVWDLYSRLWQDDNADRYGKSGERQYGVDICGQPHYLGGKCAGVQCKRYKVGTLTRAVIRNEVAEAEEFDPPLAEYTIATTDARSADLQSFVRKISEERRAAGKFPVYIVFWDTLWVRLCDTKNRGLLRKHYPELFTLTDLSSPPFMIPRRIPDLFGRQKEMETLESYFAPARFSPICAITGLPGLGKSALAFHFAREHQASFPDGVLYGSLRDDHPLAILNSFVRSYRPDLSPEHDLNTCQDMVRSLLGDKCALVVLDNAEDLDAVDDIVDCCGPGCAVLITTRDVALATEIGHSIRLGVLARADSLRLFEAHSRQAGVDFHHDVADRICGLLEDHPQALEIAAKLPSLRTWTMPELLDRLSDRRERLAVLRLKNLEVRTSFQLSYDLLAENRAGFDALAAMQGYSFDIPAAAAVLGQDEPEALLNALCDLSLLWREESGRYRQHQLLADFALANLHRSGRERDIHLLHARHYVTVARQARENSRKGGESVPDAFARFDLELPHIRAGQAWAKRHVGDKDADRLASDYPDAAAYLLALRLEPHDWIDWLKVALQAARRLGSQDAEGRHLSSLGKAHLAAGDAKEASNYFKQALEISRKRGDRRYEGRDLCYLGTAHAQLGRTREAINCYEQALKIAKAEGDRRWEMHALGNLGDAYVTLRDMPEAKERYKRALVIADETGDRLGGLKQRCSMARVEADEGSLEEARSGCEEALTKSKELGNRPMQGIVLGLLGFTHSKLGELPEAIEYYEAALDISDEIGDRRGKAEYSWSLGLLYEESEPARAVELMEAGVTYKQQLGHADAEADVQRVEGIRARLSSEAP